MLNFPSSSLQSHLTLHRLDRYKEWVWEENTGRVLGWYVSDIIPDLLIQPIHQLKEAEPSNALRISQSRLILITNPLNREKESVITVYPVSFDLVFCGEHFLQHEVASKKNSPWLLLTLNLRMRAKVIKSKQTNKKP